MTSPRFDLLLSGLVILTLSLVSYADDAQHVDFIRDVKPILSTKCFACHGPDENHREADLRFDDRDSAIEYAIVPGDPDESMILEVVSSENPKVQMPPPAAKKPPLTKEEIDLLRRWIEQGAEYQGHWSFEPIVRSEVPNAKDKRWQENPIDAFIANGHASQKLSPVDAADRRTLIRRLSFDLRGLPPTPAEVQTFENDKSSDAYDKLVDRLLSSEQFGERMAVYWLDVVRYADTGGYHSDNHRDVWAYRDYVIESFNENKSFDQFVIEQIAGDLLPNATIEQRIGSGYNRLLQTTEEGGAQAKEYQAKYDADRVRNTGVAFLAMTTGCCQCHDHKYDPMTMRDFYSFAAFFADIKERPVGRQSQTTLYTPAQKQQADRLNGEIGKLRQQVGQIDMPAFEKWRTEAEQAIKDEAKQEQIPKNIADILAIAADKRNDGQKKTLVDYFWKNVSPAAKSLRKKLAAKEAEKKKLDASAISTLISESGAPRTIRILARGDWLDDSGEIVQPALPAVFGSLDITDRRPTRLDLARWMTTPENPLVARVYVNRLWKLFFGRGIVRTVDDFGAQGDVPSHPELLDWLAMELIESDWDTKHLIQLMLRSETYRQSSRPTGKQREHDRENIYLARQGRFRLESEFVRDNALAISGLLVDKIGGPSVKPYQPTGYWKHLNFPKRKWAHDTGESQYRRGLYTYWQRSFLHPSLMAFDASSREESTCSRQQSNTPLQALVLLNDPTYVEAARVLAADVFRSTDDFEGRVDAIFQRVLQRDVSDDELAIVKQLFDKHRTQYAEDVEAAKELISVGLAPTPANIPADELAAWTNVARSVLNMQEAITRY